MVISRSYQLYLVPSSVVEEIPNDDVTEDINVSNVIRGLHWEYNGSIPEEPELKQSPTVAIMKMGVKI